MLRGSKGTSILRPVRGPVSLRRLAFRAIKKAILDGALEPGQLYKESDLARQLGMSKTPVHEALLDLASRGFVTLLPRRGIQINVLSREDIRRLYEFRSVIEEAVMRQIVPKLTDDKIAMIEKLFSKEAPLILSDDRRCYLELDRQFHMLLCRMTQNPYMISALEAIRDLVDWMGARALTRPERMREVNCEHRKIVEFLKSRDSEGAGRAMVEHVQITLDNVLRACEARVKRSKTTKSFPLYSTKTRSE